MDFEIVSEIMAIEPIAEGTGIRQLTKLMQLYGGKNWKKKKGFATVRLLASSEMVRAELHWYEAHGIGKVQFKIKVIL
jgi:hypothetical protein